jgi:hypothetical protein
MLTMVFFVSSLLHSPTAAMAQGFGNDNQGCPSDRPCFNGTYQSGNKVIFEFTGITGWDFYNVRYAALGGGTKQVENRSGRFTFNNVKPRSIYKISVQGCNSHPLRHSTCSPWTQQTFTTR